MGVRLRGPRSRGLHRPSVGVLSALPVDELLARLSHVAPGPGVATNDRRVVPELIVRLTGMTERKQRVSDRIAGQLVALGEARFPKCQRLLSVLRVQRSVEQDAVGAQAGEDQAGRSATSPTVPCSIPSGGTSNLGPDQTTAFAGDSKIERRQPTDGEPDAAIGSAIKNQPHVVGDLDLLSRVPGRRRRTPARARTVVPVRNAGHEHRPSPNAPLAAIAASAASRARGSCSSRPAKGARHASSREPASR